MIGDTKIVPVGRRFDIDPDNSVGLTLRVHGGVFVDQVGFKTAPNATLTLAASTTNYVEMDDAGVVSTNTSSFTAGYTQLYIVTTGATIPTGFADCRSSTWAVAALDAQAVANLGNAAVVPGIPVLFTLNIADASADTDIVTTYKLKVIDFFFLNTGIGAHAANDTVQVKNSTNAITDAVAKTATVNKVVRASTINPANSTISAGGTLRVTAVKDTNVAGVAHILAVRVA